MDADVQRIYDFVLRQEQKHLGITMSAEKRIVEVFHKEAAS